MDLVLFFSLPLFFSLSALSAVINIDTDRTVGEKKHAYRLAYQIRA
jgi:hypothetical protein